jgi:hypothetical protein
MTYKESEIRGLQKPYQRKRLGANTLFQTIRNLQFSITFRM